MQKSMETVTEKVGEDCVLLEKTSRNKRKFFWASGGLHRSLFSLSNDFIFEIEVFLGGERTSTMAIEVLLG